MKEIVRPKTQNYTLHLPKEYLNRDIMIQVEIISSDDNQSVGHLKTIKNTAGILSKRNIDPVSWQKKIRGEWDDRL